MSPTLQNFSDTALQTKRCDLNMRRNNLSFLYGTVPYKNLQDVISFELFITN